MKKIEKDTVAGLLLGAIIGAVGGDLVKTYIPYALSAVQKALSERYVQINYPGWYDGQPEQITVAVISQGDDPLLGTMHAFKEKRALVISEDVPKDEIEIFVAIGEQLQTRTKISDPIPSDNQRVVFDIPVIDSAWTTLILTTEPVVTGASPEIVRGDEFPWLRIAVGEVGVRESGNELDPKISQYWSATNIPLSNVDAATPWGCAFVSWVVDQAALDGNLRSARCADWRNFGTGLDGPTVGAIAVFEPFIREASSGFVGFIKAFDEETLTIVGGNINDSVEIRKFPRSRVNSYRWPIKL
ncbi:TIGR02594 family protein (plasmid) [Rhizobium leguminosarum]